jgi:hypothetical protein
LLSPNKGQFISKSVHAWKFFLHCHSFAGHSNLPEISCKKNSGFPAATVRLVAAGKPSAGGGCSGADWSRAEFTALLAAKS